MDFINNIPVIDGTVIQREEFENDFLKPQKPVILRGLWKQYPAYTKWTLDYFKEILGDVEVSLYSTKQADISRTISTPHARMKFSKYLDLIETEPTDLRMFLFPLFKLNPELLNDFGYPEITGRYLKIPFMFFGPQNAVTRMHQDIDLCNVFLTQFAGRRKVILFAPDQSEYLYRLPFNTHSIVDITKPDYTAFPALRHVIGYSTELQNGDTLFMPSGFWHHIEYIEGGFGLSLRTLNHNMKTVLKGVYNVTLRHKFDDVMLRIQGRKWFEYKKSIAYKKAEIAMQKIHENLPFD